MVTTPTPSGRGTAPAAGPRAQAPIRWPRPDRTSLTYTAVWAIGLVIALVTPAFIVPPGQKTAATSDALLALSMTVFGALIMLAAAFGLWRKHREPLVSLLGAVPAIACVAGGIMLAATKTFVS
jgi:hypothetical protein